ncbi:hypothetical protein FNF27_02889 [Cafeteria roenbergensis]|uniref:Intimal thickness related receptor IRP domain-containing protein n=1 Tax=Cafeteria roenbergensis TaxID=33653 RepID=A0A5A8ED52_CAFRO|nr:hypothetical protein FNF27_02889 [Cafeteria roenbergensis]
MARCTAAVLLGAALLSGGALGRIHDLEIVNDGRFVFDLETFGFHAGGTLNLKISDFKVVAPAGADTFAGFVLRQTENKVATEKNLELLWKDHTCLLSDIVPGPNDRMMNMSEESGSLSAHITEPGFYSLIYTRCEPFADARSSFKAHAEFVNPGGNYLSAGAQALPGILGASSLAFAVATGVWVWHLTRHGEKIHAVHHMFTVLAATRAATAASEAIQLAAIASVGHPTGWSALYYVILFCKGLLFFAAILLIGTGWSLVKPFLNKWEIRVLAFALPCQTLVNVAIVVVDEMAPGSIPFEDWLFVLHFFDAACSVAILLPVAWTVRSLATAAAADGKAREALDRQQRFRNFFIITMLFFYTTRFGNYLFDLTMPYWAQWVPGMLVELVTLLYYLWVGWTFGPVAENPYMRVRAASGDDGEFGLDDSGVDTAAASAGVDGSHAGDDGEVVAAAEEGRRPKSAPEAAAPPAAPARSPPVASSRAQAASDSEDAHKD